MATGSPNRNVSAQGNPLPSAWIETLDRMQRARQAPRYMPAALLAAIRLIEEQLDRDKASTGEISFDDFKPRFEEVLGPYEPENTDKGWEPFFHLSRRAEIWDLYNGETHVQPDAFPGQRPKSEPQLRRLVDRARFRTDLLKDLQDKTTRDTIVSRLQTLLENVER